MNGPGVAPYLNFAIPPLFWRKQKPIAFGIIAGKHLEFEAEVL
jgi:hypothetical protein